LTVVFPLNILARFDGSSRDRGSGDPDAGGHGQVPAALIRYHPGFHRILTRSRGGEDMHRQFSAGRLGVVLALCCTVAACGQSSGLQAKKYFKDANALYQQQEYQKAAAAYEAALQADPGLTVAYFYLGNSYDQLYKPSRAGEPENDALLQKAIQNYQLAVEKEQDPKMKKLALEYLVASYGPDKLNDPDKAEPLIQQMVQIDPTDPANYFALAKMYEDSGRYDEAEQILVDARDKKPSDPAVYMQLAGFYNRQGDFQKTIDALSERAKREPNNPEAFYTIATFYWDKSYRDIRIKDTEKMAYADEGLKAINKALEIKPDYPEAVTYKGLLLRVQASLVTDAGRQKSLINEAEKLQAQAAELRKKKAAGQ
jgi:tetratricopeptide (TPR) repeat protein